MAKAKHSTPWKGWSFWEGYLVDPEGNRYSPDMVRTSLYTMELSHELTGSTLQVLSLKSELKKRLAALQVQPEITIKWQGQEITLKLPSSSGR